MNLKNVFQVALAPLIIIIYGWSLLQNGEGFTDLAGAIMLFVGIAGLVVSAILYFTTGRYKWHNRWYTNVLTGIAGVGIVFILIIVTSRMG